MEITKRDHLLLNQYLLCYTLGSSLEFDGEDRVRVFQRAQSDLEVFHSAAYNRTISQCFFIACYKLRDDVPTMSVTSSRAMTRPPDDMVEC